MNAGIKEFLNEQAQTVAEQARSLRKNPVAAMRKASVKSAERIKSLNDPIRAFARSGIRLSAISQATAQSLIELQAEIVTSALSDAAAQFEKASRTVSVTDMLRGQGEILKATRDRIVDDMTRAVTILKDAGGDVRKVATDTFEKVARPAKAKAPKGRRAGAARARRPARKAARRTR